MKTTNWKSLLVAAFLCCSSITQAETKSLPTIENFFKLSNFGGASLAPDGKACRIALYGWSRSALSAGGDGHDD